MKSTGRMIGVMLLLFIVAGGSVNAQKEPSDTTRTNKAWMYHRDMSGMRHMKGMGQLTDSMKMGEMRHRFDYMDMRGRRSYMWGWRMQPEDWFGYMPHMHGMRGMGPMGWDRFSRHQYGADRLGIENIPNLTDKQKKEIADLRQKHLDEMSKYRDDVRSKIEGMRESHRKDLLNILTDEQKKFLEGRTNDTAKGSSKQK
jgi:hypothetical protein